MDYSSLFIILSAVLWGTTGTSQAFLSASIPPLVVASLRMIIGGSFLFVISFLDKESTIRDLNNKKSIIISSVCISLYQPFFFIGVSRLGVALGTILAISSAPVFSGLINKIFKIKNTKQWIFATTISIIGCIFIFYDNDQSHIDNLGVFSALSAGLSYSLFVFNSKKAYSKNSRIKTNGIIFFFGAICLSPFLFIFKGSYQLETSDLLPLLHLGIIATSLSYTLFSVGIKKVSAEKAVTYTLAEPLTASLLGILLLKETYNTKILIGVILIFIGLVINNIKKQI
ncbi:MAG: EamA family transporter [Sphaerochaetaceae bacterium]